MMPNCKQIPCSFRRREEQWLNLIYSTPPPPPQEREFVMLIDHRWGHQNGTRSSANNFDVGGYSGPQCKNSVLPPHPSRHLDPGAQATTSPRAAPSNEAGGEAFGLDRGRAAPWGLGNVKK